MKMVSGRRGGLLQGWLFLLLVLLLILAVTGWFVARSDGFRALVAGRISDRTGLDVHITDSYVGWPYVLVLRGVETSAAGEAGFQIQELRFGRRLWQWTLRLRGGRVWFDQGLREDAPFTVSRSLVRLAGLREAGAIDVMRATAHLQGRWRVALDNLDVLWVNAEGVPVASVRQLQFQMEPVDVPSGRMYYYRIAYPGVAENALGSIRNLEWEWLTRGGDDYVEILRNGVLPPVAFSE